jgi:hypothetical protein
MIFFFNCNANNVFQAIKFTNFFSSTSAGHLSRGEMKGMGYYIPMDNIAIRRSIALYSVRSLPKHTWINNCDVFYKDQTK